MRWTHSAVGLTALVSIVAAPSHSAPGDGTPVNQAEDMKHGAVLCTWGIFEGVRQAGERCFAGKDPEFQAALGQSMSRIDAFIIANAPATPADLEARRKAVLAEAGTTDICKSPAAVYFYQALRDRGPASLKTMTDELLAVPRHPEMNPCM
jgi:hypothetical protein